MSERRIQKMKIFVKILNFAVALFKLAWLVISFPFKLYKGIMELAETVSNSAARKKNV